MIMNPPTVPRGYVNAPSYDELVQALELIRHATAPTPDDDGHHENAHELADAMLKRVEARKQYEAQKRASTRCPTTTRRRTADA